MSAVTAVSGWNAISSSAQSSTSQNNDSFLGIFEQLELALESGDLAAALQAYSSLASQAENAAGQQPGIPSLNALKTVGQQLASGNLSGAKQALSNIGRGSPREPSAKVTEPNPANSDPVQESGPEEVSTEFSVTRGKNYSESETMPHPTTIDLLV